MFQFVRFKHLCVAEKNFPASTRPVWFGCRDGRATCRPEQKKKTHGKRHEGSLFPSNREEGIEYKIDLLALPPAQLSDPIDPYKEREKIFTLR